eukprot:3841032-Prymnesium_polylepis.2
MRHRDSVLLVHGGVSVCICLHSVCALFAHCLHGGDRVGVETSQHWFEGGVGTSQHWFEGGVSAKSVNSALTSIQRHWPPRCEVIGASRSTRARS